MLEDLLLILAILAAAHMIFRVIAREGVLGVAMQNIVFQSTRPKVVVVLACIFWAAWYCAADM
jgi:hypothetical protein